MRVEKIDVANFSKWDELVAASPQGTIFHTSDWLTIMNESSNGKLNIFLCYDNASAIPKVVGGCALTVKRKLFFKVATDSFNRTPYGGVLLGSQSPNIQEIITSLILRLQKNFNIVKLVHSPLFSDIRPFTWNGWRCDVRYTYVLDLKGDLEQNMSKRARNTISKAVRNSIVIRKVDALENADIESYWTLESETFKRQGVKQTMSLDGLEKILRQLYDKEKGALWFAETPSGELIAAEIVVYDNKIAHRWSAASCSKFQNSGAVSLLLYEIAKDLKNRLGYEQFNLMAANTQCLASFVSSLNPLLVPYYSSTKSTVRHLVDGLVDRFIG